METKTETQQLHAYFIPHMAPGHMIPMIDIAREFARRGAKVTILTTPLNAAQISIPIQKDKENGSEIGIKLLQFPYKESGLPEGCENMAATTTSDQMLCFLNALDLLRRPVEKLAAEDRPDFIVGGVMYTWATELASNLGIPKLSFWGTGFLPMCTHHVLFEQKPHEKIESDSEEFVIPGLPDAIKASKRQLPEALRDNSENTMKEILVKVRQAEEGSYGMITNSFFELEPAYVKHWREVIGKKAWHIGPVSLYNRGIEDKSQRGQVSSISEQDCLNWLNSKEPNSVIYLSFGSMAIFSPDQLQEIAIGLEASGVPFIWVVKQSKTDAPGKAEDVLPEGFERRTEDRGLIIRGWAPQVLILDHEAIGGFVTHCGWNSLLEGVAAGVPMVTWPLSAEQFFNESLISEILRIGVRVGAQAWTRRTESRVTIDRGSVEVAVRELMVGDEADDRRKRAISLKDLARKAVDSGGSSDNDFNSLLEELRKMKMERKQQ